jgi:hypothetical protein
MDLNLVSTEADEVQILYLEVTLRKELNSQLCLWEVVPGNTSRTVGSEVEGEAEEKGGWMKEVCTVGQPGSVLLRALGHRQPCTRVSQSFLPEQGSRGIYPSIATPQCQGCFRGLCFSRMSYLHLRGQAWGTGAGDKNSGSSHGHSPGWPVTATQ